MVVAMKTYPNATSGARGSPIYTPIRLPILFFILLTQITSSFFVECRLDGSTRQHSSSQVPATINLEQNITDTTNPETFVTQTTTSKHMTTITSTNPDSNPSHLTTPIGSIINRPNYSATLQVTPSVIPPLSSNVQVGVTYATPTTINFHHNQVNQAIKLPDFSFSLPSHSSDSAPHIYSSNPPTVQTRTPPPPLSPPLSPPPTTTTIEPTNRSTDTVSLSSKDEESTPVITSTLNTTFRNTSATNNGNHQINHTSMNQNSNIISSSMSPTFVNSTATSSVHPLLIYSIRHEIRSYDLYNLSARSSSNGSGGSHSTSPLAQFDQHTSKHSKTLISNLKNTIGLDFYYSDSESYIFWTDVIEERIYKGSLINGSITNSEIVVQTALATAEGLAVDWVGHNIYWVESTLDHIEVANMNGSCRRTLIAGEMESPRAIAVDPRLGLLFWTDWDKKQPRIERATMSGEDRKVIVRIKDVNGSWPNGLTLDYESKKIYWIDANSDSIHFSDYEGNNPQSLLRHIKSLGHPFSITLFENNLYWTDWKTNSVSMANKYDGSEVREVQRLTGTRLFDIKVFHPSRQPKVGNQLNPCFINNGNCSHFCLLSGVNTRKCECPHLKKLSKDGITCQDDDHILLIGRTNEIRAVDVDEPLYQIMSPISIPKVFNPRQFEYDAKSKTIFWVDLQTNEVKRAQLAGTSIDTIIDVIIESPNGLALDWISGNIYVTSVSHKSGKIYISNLNGEYISILMDSSHGIISPKSIAVHPTLGLLFCIDENEDGESIIFVSGMDGHDKRIIASKFNDPKLKNSLSLAIDYDLNRVYWINLAISTSDNASIQYYDILGDKIVTVLDESESFPGSKINPNIICINGEYLLTVSTHTQADIIMKMPKDNLTQKTILKTQNLSGLSALRVYNATSQSGSNACSQNNGGCSQLCVPTNSTHRVCKCTIGYSINPLNETECTGKDLFLIYSCNLGLKGISLEANSSPDEYFLPPIHKAFRASSIDYVYKDNFIYWVDNEEGSITKINRDTTNYQVVIQNLESEESIGIDWVAGNIYWLDPYLMVIEVAHLNGSDRYVIVSGDMDKANSLVVNPIMGYIVWSDIGSIPKIEIARLDGSDRRVLVSYNLSRIEDLALDYVEDYIYWVDSTLGIIERIRGDGTGRQLVFSESPNTHSHLVSIAVHKDYLFVADSLQSQGSIIRTNKNDTSSRQVIRKILGDGIRDIAVFAEQPIPTPEENPCVENNGDCQGLCLFMGIKGRKRCICAHGRLKQDGLTCEPYDTFVLFSKLSQIDSLHIQEGESYNNAPYPPISIENKSNIISLTVDYNAQRVIYSDLTHSQICSLLFNGTDRRVLVEKQSLVEGIAFARDQLYWTSIQDNSISRLNTTSLGVPKRTCDDLGCKTAVIEKIIPLGSEDKPRGIAVDSCTSYIYWTNWNNNAAAIQRASPRTGYKIESIIKTNIKFPNGITIDHSLRKLYWCDAKLDKIESCDMDGSNRVILSLALTQHPFALAIWENHVYWTDWLTRGVSRADKYTGRNPVQIKRVSQRPMGIAVAAPEISECPNDPCIINNGGCSPSENCFVVPDEYSCTKTRVMCHNSRSIHDMRIRIAYEYGIRCGKEAGGRWDTKFRNHLEMSPPFDHVNLEPIDYNNSTLDPRQLEIFFEDEAKSTQSGTKHVLPDDETNSRFSGQPFNSTQVYGESSETRHSLISDISNSSITTQIPDVKENDSENTSSINHELSTVTPPPVIINTTLPLEYHQGASRALPTFPPIEIVSRTQKTEGPSTQTPLLISTTVASSTPMPNATTIPPCQIVPAALQPTTEATTNNECKEQFKCYLSERLVCIPFDRRCDGNYDCPSKEDENDCIGGPKRVSYNMKRETNWHRFVTVILIILAAAVAALFLVFGTKGRRRWFVGSNGAFNHRRMFDDNSTNIEISNPMFDEDDPGNLVHCAFSIDLNERTTNFSNPLYERQVLLMDEKHPSIDSVIK